MLGAIGTAHLSAEHGHQASSTGALYLIIIFVYASEEHIRVPSNPGSSGILHALKETWDEV